MNQGVIPFGGQPGFGRRSMLPAVVQQVFSSRTWTAPGDGWAEFLVFGAGGSGALSVQGNLDTRAQGGAGGGTAWARRRVTRGQQFVITLGAGGSGRSTGGTGTLNGNAGGNTTLVGPGLNIFIPGGLGGSALANSASAISPQARSVPVGGDINIPGGVAGGISGALGTAGGATGGAGVALGVVDPDSGSIVEIGATGSATGGAGVHPSGSLAAGTATAGGGVTAPSTSATAVAGWTFGAAGVSAPNFAWGTMFLTGASTAASTTANNFSTSTVSWGTGSGGSCVANNTAAGVTGDAVFGGSGGIGNNNTSANYGTGAVSYAGGSGGCAVTDATAGTNWYTGKGGDAIAFIAFFPGD